MVVNANDKIFSGLVIAFVAIVIGTALLGTIANTIGELTTTFSQTNRSFTASNNTAVSFITSSQNVSAISAVRAGATLLTLNQNFTQNIPAGTITMNISYANGENLSTEVWGVDYTFTSNSFIDDAGARSVTRLITLFFALAIMAAGFIAVKFEFFSLK